MDERTPEQVKESISELIVTEVESPSIATEVLIKIVAEEDIEQLMIFASTLNLYIQTMKKLRGSIYFRAEDAYQVLGMFHHVQKAVQSASPQVKEE